MKTIVCALVLCCVLGSAALGAEDYPGSLMDSLAHYAGMGLNWSEAHIGNFPHIGGGLSLGLVSTPLKGVAALATAAGADSSPLDAFAALTKSQDPGAVTPVMLMPVYVLDGRIGGFFLPFDVGAKIGFMPDMTEKQMITNQINYWYNFFLWGVDLRYAVLPGGVILPKVSIGVGYNSLTGGLGLPIAGDTPKRFDVTWKTETIEFKAQVSKSLWILTPYIGGAGGIAFSTVSHVASGSLNAGQSAAFDAEETRGFGRVFAGVSANGAVAAADLQFAVTIPNADVSVTLGARAVY